MYAFYDAKAGLEEGRGRLSQVNPNSSAVLNCVFPAGQTAMPLRQVCYIVNPAAGEVVDPTNLDPANPYADFEYKDEWGVDVTADNVQKPFIASVSSTAGGANIVGPLYKWVRITPRTNLSAKFGTENSALFFDGMNSNSAVTSAQILTITSLAVTPNGSRRMVQYTVARSIIAAALPNFPAALTLDGNGVCFNVPNCPGYAQGTTPQLINGTDSNPATGAPPGVPAIGYTNSDDYSNKSSGLSAAAASSNILSPSPVPNVAYLPPASPTLNGLSSTLQTPSGLDALVQALAASADAVVKGPVTQSDSNNIMPAGMSATNPVTVVINGDFTINGWHNAGYGLLVVTGQLKYDPDATWNGLILVVGQGAFVSNQNGKGQINGAVLIANTLDSSGKLLPNLGPASFSTTGGGNGIQYSSYWVKAAQAMLPYQVLSFREIAQTTP
jgi:hypothetical protein